GLEVSTRSSFDVGEKVRERGVGILPLLDIALHAAEERVLSHVGDQLTKHARALVVGDRVEIQIDRLDIGDVGGDRMGRGQLVLSIRPALNSGTKSWSYFWKG